MRRQLPPKRQRGPRSARRERESEETEANGGALDGKVALSTRPERVPDLPTRLADGLGFESTPVLRPAPRKPTNGFDWVPRSGPLRDRIRLLVGSYPGRGGSQLGWRFAVILRELA